jgi:hypothetical protein
VNKILISYEFRGTTRTIDDVHVCITGLGIAWHVLPTTWIIETDSSVGEVVTHLKEDDKDGEDSFLVVSISAPWSAVKINERASLFPLLGHPSTR